MKRKWRGYASYILAAILVGFAELFLIGIERTPYSQIVVGFIAVILQFILTVVVGGTIGVLIAEAIRKSTTLNTIAVRLLGLGLWFPVLGLWAISYVSTVAAVAVMAATCYYQLSIITLTSIGTDERRLLITEEIVLHGLLISLLTHLLEPGGFPWVAIADSNGELRAIAIFVFVVATIAISWSATGLGFGPVAEAYAAIYVRALARDQRMSGKVSVGLAVLCVFAWQILSLFGPWPIIGTPWSFLKRAMAILFDYQGITLSRNILWSDIAISLVEICVGLSLSVAVAFLLYKFLKRTPRIGHFIYKALPFTFVTPIIVIPFFVKFKIFGGYWLSMISVAFISFFPCMRMLCGAGSNLSMKYRIIIALRNALPYAFVGMLFGESLHSFGGLGFAINLAMSRGSDETIIIFSIIFVLLSLLSYIFQVVAQRVDSASLTGERQ